MMTFTDRTSVDMERELRSHLTHGEKLVWIGRPKTGLKLRGSDTFFIPFSLLWGGFAIFWELTVIATNSPLIFKLWGIPFVVVGLYLIVGRFFIDAKRRANTMYGITHDRIIIRSGVLSKNIQSFSIKNLPAITIKEKEDKSGTITFGMQSVYYSKRRNSELPGAGQPPQLEFIDNVKSVYDKLIELQRQQER